MQSEWIYQSHAKSRSAHSELHSLLPVVTPELASAPRRGVFCCGARELQIADSATDLLILGVAGGLPKCSGYVVLKGDQGRHPPDTAVVQVLLAGPRQRESNPMPPMPFAHSEPIHVPPPPIPASDQSTDDLTATLGNQKGGRGISNQALDVLQAVGRSCVLTPSLSP
jgi:hypothetical protein